MRMKQKYLKKLIASNVAVLTLLTLVPMKASAEWIKNYNGAWSYTEGDSYATGWRQINGTWYYFDVLGQMQTGWIQSGGEWYYADLNGAMQTGVIQIEGKIYLFSASGAMQIGNCIINGNLYDFNDKGVFVGDSAPVPTKAFDYYGNSTIPYVPNQIINQNATMSSDIPSDGKPQVTQYKVKFKDPDDDNTLLQSNTVDDGTVLTLYKPAKSGYTFVEWNTRSDGSGTSYEYDDTIRVNKDYTLYAQWEEDSSSTSSSSNSTDSTVKVTGIAVSAVNGATTISSKGGSLQMTKIVSPSTATMQTVTWSVTNVTGQAAISTNGKLTAVANGTVTVTATASDGSGVVGTLTITISGQ
jgi:uncharacterized repeat protein (TIGR02543 family)